MVHNCGQGTHGHPWRRWAPFLEFQELEAFVDVSWS